jgi:hypothetical protein
MKKSKVLVPALGILVLSTAASITGTVAWFSVNNSVTVDGMEVTTKVAGNLLITDDNTSDANYGSVLHQARKGVLEPASTTNNVDYFYTTDAKADGSKQEETTDKPYVAYNESTALANTAAGKEKYDAAFLKAYTEIDNTVTEVTTNNVVYGYIDYSFYLKATNTSANPYVVRMTKCNLKYNNAALGATDLAWRVGVFAKVASKETPVTDEVATGNHKSILKQASAAYFDGTAVTSTTAKAAPSKLNEAVVVTADIAQNATVYEKVTVRLWLEGEDTSCNNETYAALTNSWKLDLQFELVDKTDATKPAVTAISSIA